MPSPRQTNRARRLAPEVGTTEARPLYRHSTSRSQFEPLRTQEGLARTESKDALRAGLADADTAGLSDNHAMSESMRDILWGLGGGALAAVIIFVVLSLPQLA